MRDLPIVRTSDKQTTLIRRFCEEAERALDEASDYTAALHLKESLCQRFREECDSSLVVNATRQYLDEVLKKRWKVHDGATDSENGSH
jgi:hypothetical protein